jgi:hypothetical protein
MSRSIFQTVGLLLLFTALIIPAGAEEIFPGVEFPKIIYGDPNFYWSAGNNYNAVPGDYDLIDEAGFNMILSDYNCPGGGQPYVLNTALNTDSIPVMFRLYKFTNMGQYLRSTVIRRNITEDAEYRIDGDQDYPGWTPRIRVRWDAIDTDSTYDDCEGYRFEDIDLVPLHDIVRYDHLEESGVETIFTTMDGQNSGGEKDFLFKQKIHAFAYLENEDPRETFIRIKVKIVGDISYPSIALLELTFDHTPVNYPRDPLGSEPYVQSGYVSLDNIECYNEINNPQGYREGDYNWAFFQRYNNGVFQPFEVYYCQNNDPSLKLSPQITLKSVVNYMEYTVFIDSLEVWELEAYGLTFNYNDHIYLINDDLDGLVNQSGFSLVKGFDSDDLHPNWYHTNAIIANIIRNHTGTSTFWNSGEFEWKRRLISSDYPQNNEHYDWTGPDWYWNLPLSSFFDTFDQQCGEHPNFQSAYQYPFEESNLDLQEELDELIGNYDANVDTGRGFRYLYGSSKSILNANIQPICHLSAFHERHTPSTANDDHPLGSVRFRFPTKGELNAETYLALAYGMRGLGYFLFQSATCNVLNEPIPTWEPQLGDPFPIPDFNNSKMIGIFHRDGVGSHFEKTGEEVPPGSGNYENGFDDPAYQYTPADELKNIFADLDLLAPCLNNLEWEAGGCYQHSINPDPYVCGIHSISGNTIGHIEVTRLSYAPGGDPIPAGTYYMVVNRDVDDAQDITIALDNLTTDYFLEDMVTHQLYYALYGGQGYILFDPITFEAGEGKLFRVTNSFTWQGEVRISGDYTLPRDLTISAGTTIKVYDGGKIIVPNGKHIFANGTPEDHITFTAGGHKWSERNDPPNWNGIELQGTLGNTVFNNCDFRECYCEWKLIPLF